MAVVHPVGVPEARRAPDTAGGVDATIVFATVGSAALVEYADLKTSNWMEPVALLVTIHSLVIVPASAIVLQTFMPAVIGPGKNMVIGAV